MNQKFDNEMVKKTTIQFEKINLNEFIELEEVVTADWGTVSCCPKS